MVMEKEFVSYELSVKLKELGFDDPCCGYYDNWIKELDTISSEVCERLCKHDTHIKAPTFSQAFRFFRENFSLDVTFRKMEYGLESNFTGYYFSIYRGNELIDIHGADKKCKLYEKLELECLKKLIEIVKQK